MLTFHITSCLTACSRNIKRS